MAAELGVSIDEVNSAMVQLTVAGVKAPEAATSIRSSMMALIKPSADMKKALHDAFGMDSGEQMIGAYGYQGALDKLRDSTDGTIAEFVKLIPNVRGINAGSPRDRQQCREGGSRVGTDARCQRRVDEQGVQDIH